MLKFLYGEFVWILYLLIWICIRRKLLYLHIVLFVWWKINLLFTIYEESVLQPRMYGAYMLGEYKKMAFLQLVFWIYFNNGWSIWTWTIGRNCSNSKEDVVEEKWTIFYDKFTNPIVVIQQSCSWNSNSQNAQHSPAKYQKLILVNPPEMHLLCLVSIKRNFLCVFCYFISHVQNRHIFYHKIYIFQL